MEDRLGICGCRLVNKSLPKCVCPSSFALVHFPSYAPQFASWRGVVSGNFPRAKLTDTVRADLIPCDNDREVNW